jgi:signal transduction histidine kinase
VTEAVAAIRALSHGGLDDGTRALDLPPVVRPAVSPAINALRWGALGYGLVFSAPQAVEGSFPAVVATAVCLFVTTWRTVLPVRLGETDRWHRTAPFVDLVLIAAAVGYAGGLESSYFFSLLAAVVVLTFGWGWRRGIESLGVAAVVMTVGLAVGPDDLGTLVDDQRDVAALAVLTLAMISAGLLRDRFVAQQRQQETFDDEIDRLTEANELLALVNTAARSLPTSLTLREALERVRRQLEGAFGARVICLMTWDEHAEEWVPRLADGCTLRPAYRTSELPGALASATAAPGPLLVPDLTTDATMGPVREGSGCGLYLRLDARDTTVGLIALEHPTIDHWNDASVEILDGLGEVLALTVDNARWFGRLRSLGAEEERVRIARDLHDRLGQWLTYISFELERIMNGGGHEDTAAADPELVRLHGDVGSAIDELRETLLQLRSGVSNDQPLAVVGRRLVERFRDRAEVAVTFTATRPEDRLPIPLENELLRILQEALNNVDRHAKASHVDVLWDVRGGNFELTVRDDGRGFDLARGVRESAYGLVGMRERADVIGARLEIESRPGGGTTVRVTAGGETPAAGDWPLAGPPD